MSGKSITITIQAASAAEMAQHLKALAASVGMVEASPTTPNLKPSQSEDAPITIQHTETIPPKAPPTPALTPTPAPATPAAPTITLEALRTKAVALAQAGKSAQIQTVLQQFGVTRLTDLPADKYAEFDAALGAI